MKNSTLTFRSVGIVILLAGIAHLFTFAENNDNSTLKDNVPIVLENELTSDSLESANLRNPVENKSYQSGQNNPANYKQDTDYIIDKWKVTYNSEEFKGSIIYDIKKEGRVFNAYTYQYEDDQGYAQEAEGTKSLVIESYDGYKGKGIYLIAYEGEKYEVNCQIDMVDENTFKLSYDYYGYSDVETWKRQ